MTLVRWDSSRDVAGLQEGMSRMLEGFYVRPQEDLEHPGHALLQRGHITVTASMSSC